MKSGRLGITPTWLLVPFVKLIGPAGSKVTKKLIMTTRQSQRVCNNASFGTKQDNILGVRIP